MNRRATSAAAEGQIQGDQQVPVNVADIKSRLAAPRHDESALLNLVADEATSLSRDADPTPRVVFPEVLDSAKVEAADKCGLSTLLASQPTPAAAKQPRQLSMSNVEAAPSGDYAAKPSFVNARRAMERATSQSLRSTWHRSISSSIERERLPCRLPASRKKLLAMHSNTSSVICT
jgi:hypothetical protein